MPHWLLIATNLVNVVGLAMAGWNSDTPDHGR